MPMRPYLAADRGSVRLLFWHVEVRDGALESFRRHADGLRQGRVGVDGQADVLGVGAELDGECRLRNEVARRGPDDAAADDALGRRVEEDFGNAVVPAERKRPS